jgi:hypothetical protein
MMESIANFKAKALGFSGYQDYLKNSFYWHNFKKRFLTDTCAGCLGRRYKGPCKWMEMHHLTYDRLGNELPEDCATLCTFCHEQATRAEWNDECPLEDTVLFLRKKHLGFQFQMAFNFDDQCNQPDRMPDELKKAA